MPVLACGDATAPQAAWEILAVVQGDTPEAPTGLALLNAEGRGRLVLSALAESPVQVASGAIVYADLTVEPALLRSQIFKLDRGSSAPRPLFTRPIGFSDRVLDWSPVTKRLLLRRNGKLITANENGGDADTLNSSLYPRFARFSPDGRRIVVSGWTAAQFYGCDIEIVHLDGAPPSSLGFCDPQVLWSPDGKSLAVFRPYEEKLVFFSPQGVRQRAVTVNWRLYPSSWRPDGKALLATGWQYSVAGSGADIVEVDVETGSVTSLSQGGYYRDPRWTRRSP